ncbi:MAG TPA: hypothetical protein VF282_06095 [Bacillota bacterium]
MLSLLVSGVAWYVSATHDAYVLPAETAVGLPRAVAAMATGRLAHLLLPEGTLALRRSRLPLQPVPVDRIFPIGAAEVTWSPDPDRWQIGTDIPILSPNWHHLFRERAWFDAWDDTADHGPLRAWRERFGPRATFREGLDRREIRFKYPQLVEPELCYRLNGQYLAQADKGTYAPVAVVQQQLRLAAAEGEGVVVFGPGDFGWVARAYASAGEAAIGKVADSATPRSLEELEDFIAQRGRFWRVEPVRREANLVLPGGA